MQTVQTFRPRKSVNHRLPQKVVLLFPTIEVGVITSPSSSLEGGSLRSRDQQVWLRVTGTPEPGLCPIAPVLWDVQPGRSVTTLGTPQQHW